MAEQNMKKAWVKPEVVSLDVEKTLGGIVSNVSESIIYTAPGNPPINGSS